MLSDEFELLLGEFIGENYLLIIAVVLIVFLFVFILKGVKR